MRISVDLSQNEAERLETTTERLGIRPEELARVALTDLLSHPEEDFERITEHVLRKNRELYRRLS